MADRAEVQQQLAGLMSRLTLGQKLMIGIVTLGAIAAIIFLVTVVNTPTYGTLFSNLSEEDASKIVAKLQEKSIPYQLNESGKSILVPKDKVYEVRLSLAGEGLPQSSIIGYEIFDRTNLGISDFVQKVNYRRALEGELARTILTIEEVEGARVHLVVPERALFKEDEKPATASVVLKLKSSKPPKIETIQGIAHLISSSVEGLESENVTIVDARGVLLSDVHKSNSVAALTTTQYEMQQRVEAYLAAKAQTLLESVVGSGNALVQVNAELDFRQVERTLEQFDPDRTAVRSEQLSEEKTSSGDSLTPSTRSNTVTNYEINKTVEHIVENLGNLKRLSVAALVNGVPTTVTKDGQQVTEIQPRPEQEMQKLTDLVKMSVGFDAVRNDEVSVTNLTFALGRQIPDQEFVFRTSPMADWTEYKEEIFLGVAMLGTVLVLWSLLRRFRSRIALPVLEQEVPTLGQQLEARKPVIELPPAEDEISTEVLLRNERRKRISEYIRDKPGDSARLLKVWLAEE